jgi:norsolorinic acid ketoreductase
MSFDTTVIVTGSKSGIGKGLLSTYASRPNTLAIAAIRDGPDSEVASTLTSLPTGAGSKIVVAKYDAGSPTAAVELVKFLQSTHQVKSLDVVVANAGILKHFGPAREASSQTMMEHFEINTVAPVLLYQATQPLLSASKHTPKFFMISSSIGSNGLQDHYPMPMIAYGMSKAAINWAASRIHREEDRIVVVAMQPGWVQTAMGNKAAAHAGMSPEDVPVTLEDSVNGLIGVFDKADKDSYSGLFFDQTGSQLPW